MSLKQYLKSTTVVSTKRVHYNMYSQYIKHDVAGVVHICRDVVYWALHLLIAIKALITWEIYFPSPPPFKMGSIFPM